MVSEITRIDCKPDQTPSWFLCQGALQANFNYRLWNSDHDFLIAFHCNFLSQMHGFPDNEVLLPTGYDVIVISPLQAILHDEFWKNDHDFLIEFASKYLYGMHGFRDNEVWLQAEYDVIVIYPLGGASGDFAWRILKELPWLPDCVL